jgi:transcriptional regulator with XRE-family HTH domain
MIKNYLDKLMEREHLTATKIAKMLNLTDSAISQFKNGASGLKISNIKQLAKVLNCSIGELFGEEPINNHRVVNIKFIEKINLIDSFDDLKNEEQYSNLSIDENLFLFLGLYNNIKSLIIIKQPNNSMYPMIETGDLIVIDISQNELIKDGFYLLKEQGTIVLRQVIIDKRNDKIKVSATNKEFFGNNGNVYSQKDLKNKIYGRMMFYTRSVF